MTGLPLIIAFVLAVVLMIVAISKFKVHPFLAIMAVSLLLALVAGIPLVNKEVDGHTVTGIAGVIGAGFSGTFSSIGIVIILGALIGSILEQTGAALKLADMVVKLVGKKILMAFFIVMMLFDPGIVPEYMIIRKLGLMGTKWSVILSQACNV